MKTAIGMGFQVERAVREKEYFEPAMVLITALKGSVEIDYGSRKDKINKGEAVLVNIGVLYSLRSYDNALVGKCHWTSSLLSEVLKGRHAFFYCNTAAEYSRYNKEIMDLLENMTAVYAEGERQTDSLIMGYLFRILDLLVEHYQVTPDRGKRDSYRVWAAEASKGEAGEAVNRGTSGSDEDAYMPAIMQYILQNLHDRVSLTDLAEQMFVSTSTLSRVFKKNTGVYFADYVMQLRVREAAAILRDTDDSLTQVAMQMGFSGSSVFSRAFKKEMGVTPGEYRERIRRQKAEHAQQVGKEDSEIRKELLAFGTKTEDGLLRRLVTADLNDMAIGPLEMTWNTVLNLGEVCDLTKANIQEHCLFLRDHLHFRYVRLWNVFSRNLMLSDGRTSGRYNFSILDQVLDFLMRNRLKPFLDFGRRPSMAMHADGKKVYYEETYTKFASGELWEEAVREVMSHINRKYGRDEVKTWYLELSRDSLHQGDGERCYEDENFDFFEAWKFAYLTAKELNPDVSFGGISAILGNDFPFLRSFYSKCAEQHCVPDFCSFGHFPYTSGEIIKGEKCRGDRMMTESGQNIEELLDQAHQLMEETGMKTAKLFLTDWNNTIVNRDYLNDSCFRAAFLVSEILRMQQKADLVCVMSGTDWISYYLDATAIVHGGIGLLTKDFIRKPAYFAMEFLGRLGNVILARGEDYILTRAASGSYYLLCYNYRPLHYGSYPVENGTGPDLSVLQPQEEPSRALSFKLSGMPEKGYYCIKQRTLSSSSGSILNEWENFQFAEDLTSDDIRYLRERCIPEIRMSKKYVTDMRELTFEVEMKPENVVLLHIYKG